MTDHATLAAVTSLVHLAVDGEDSLPLVAAAARELRRPVALVDSDGRDLGHAPVDDAGRRAMAVARAAARCGLVAPPGWTIEPVPDHPPTLGYLAVGAGNGSSANGRESLHLVASLVAGLLERLALRRTQRRALVRALVTDAHIDPRHVRREAAELRLALVERYWPALLCSGAAALPPDMLDAVERETARRMPGALAAALDDGIVLLYPDTPGARTTGRRWLEAIVALARTRLAAARAHVVTRDAAVDLAELPGAVADLATLRRLGRRANDEELVVSARQFALDRLLSEVLDGARASRFVHQQLGPLLAWDREHRSDLLGVLEAALDLPRVEDAARRCFMHRNTFRHHLRQAHEILGTSLEDADARLAAHVALKVRHLGL